MSLLSDTEYLLHVFQVLVAYLPTTLRISALSLLWAVAIALPVAVIQLRKIPVLDPVTRVYVLLARACPLMIQIYLVYFGIPLLLLYLRQAGRMDITLPVPPETLAILALSISPVASSSGWPSPGPWPSSPR